MSLLTNRKRHADLESGLMAAGGSMAAGRVHARAAVLGMGHQQGPLCSARSSARCHAAAWGGGVWGRMDACVCAAELLCCAPETIATL